MTYEEARKLKQYDKIINKKFGLVEYVYEIDDCQEYKTVTIYTYKGNSYGHKKVYKGWCSNVHYRRLHV